MKKGFTLAELLITITIVGVIAVLTVPNLIKNAHSRANVAVLQTVYAEMSSAVKNVMSAQNVKEFWDVEFIGDTPSQKGLYFLSKNLKVVKDCGATPAGCFAASYKELNKTRQRTDFLHRAENFVKLNNGAAVALRLPRTDVTGVVYVDVNGASAPNIKGKDLFEFYISSDGVVGVGYKAFASKSAAMSDCATFDSYGGGCFAYLQLNNWIMDY